MVPVTPSMPIPNSAYLYVRSLIMHCNEAKCNSLLQADLETLCIVFLVYAIKSIANSGTDIKVYKLIKLQSI